jgi:hypothetical protein
MLTNGSESAHDRSRWMTKPEQYVVVDSGRAQVYLHSSRRGALRHPLQAVLDPWRRLPLVAPWARKQAPKFRHRFRRSHEAANLRIGLWPSDTLSRPMKCSPTRVAPCALVVERTDRLTGNPQVRRRGTRSPRFEISPRRHRTFDARVIITRASFVRFSSAPRCAATGPCPRSKHRA